MSLRNNSIKVNADIIIYILLGLYVITPQYFEVIGINGGNIIASLIVVAIFLKCGPFLSTKASITVLKISILIWFIFTSMSLLYNMCATEIIYRFMRCILLFFALEKFCNSYQRFLGIIKALVLTGGIVAVFGIIEEVTRFNIFSLLLTSGTELNYNPLRFGILRILSFSSHTIVYGVYIMFILSLCIYLDQFANARERRWYKVIYYLLLLNLVLTLSRSIIICTTILLFVLNFFRGKIQFFVKLLKYLSILVLLGILASVLFPKVFAMFKMLWYMILAVFDDGYSSMIANAFGEDNLNATGNRLDLYAWVCSSMGTSWLWGHGMNAIFHYPYPMTNGFYTWTQYKDSIEVQYLNILFRYGLTGLISSICVYVSTIYTCIRGGFKLANWEKKLSFNKICICTFSAYYLMFFAVNQSSEQNIFYLFIMLLVCYNRKIIRR